MHTGSLYAMPKFVAKVGDSTSQVQGIDESTQNQPASIDSVRSVDPFAALLFFMAFLAALFFKK
jgi:hypothetical protein